MFGFLAAAAALVSTPIFTAHPCLHHADNARVRCGAVIVPENRALPKGRTVALNVIIIGAAKMPAKPQALFDLEGGPGLADTKNAAFYLGEGTAYAATRDVVLIDQRGTGGSNPLDCPEFDRNDQALAPMFPLALVRSCRARLGAQADLTRYTTSDAVADLEAVRIALGYPQIDLVALSYGTTLALRYIAEHESAVRSAVLLSTVPPWAMPPRFHAEAAQAALDQLIADCRADSLCNRSYPHLESDLALAVHQIATSSGIDPGAAMERLRAKLYSPEGARQLPKLIHRLAQGDFSALTASNPRAAFNYFDGPYLTITCSESLPWFPLSKARARAKATLFGAYRLDRQVQACANWPRAKVPARFFGAVGSKVPVLFLSGGRDPVSPARWSQSMARQFPRGRQITMPWSAHVFDGLSGIDTCYDPQVLRFIEAADTTAVDADCFAAMLPPPFD